jgi:putative ABC transport system substrate-binding protein
MRRFFRYLAELLILVLLCLPIATDAQHPGKEFRVGHLSGGGKTANKFLVDAFRNELRARGYVEGQNLVLEEQYADGKFERLPFLAQELIQRNPDALLVATTPGNLAAKAATATIPIVFVGVADPVGAGIVPSLARQGGNITGITNIVAELAGKRLEILKEIVPKATRIGIIVNPNDQNMPLQMRYAMEGARRLGIKLDPILEVRTAGDLEKAFEAAAKARVPAMLRLVDPLASMLRKQTAALSLRYQLPVMYAFREDVAEGGLVAYGANASEQYRQAATLVDKILRGAKPGDLPVEQPTKFDLVINARTAKELKLTIPASLSFRAEVID